MKKAHVILLCLFAACSYGVVHDQITVRLAIEYFTIAHPPIFRATSPTLLGLCWGIAATSGIGVGLGTILALVSQSDGYPPYPIAQIKKDLLRLVAAMAIASSLAGVVGYQLSKRDLISIASHFAETIPLQKHDRFVAVWFMHLASYIVGFGWGSFLCYRVWRDRGKPAVLGLFPSSPVATIRAISLLILGAFVLWLRFRP